MKLTAVHPPLHRHCANGIHRHRYKVTFWEDNFGMSYFWIPANVIIFSVPLHLRLPMTHFFSFWWCMILSFWRGAQEGKEDADEVVAVDAK